MSQIEFKGDPSQGSGPLADLFKNMGGKTPPKDGTPAGEEPKAGEGMKRGGKVGSASKRADGIAARGKTRGKLV